MAEFSFDGGYQGDMSFEQHYEDRQLGLPRHGQVVDLPPESAINEDPQNHGIRVERVTCSGLVNSELGFAGMLPNQSIPQLEEEIARRWGGGDYELHLSSLLGVPSVRPLSVIGRSKPLRPPVRSVPLDVPVAYSLGTSAPAPTPAPAPAPAPQPAPEPAPDDASDERPLLKVEVGMTVWIELSNDGPYKVIAPYEHALGADVPAHHTHDPDNHYERVRVKEDLWLCQDRKGKVHILSAGSLTNVSPEGAFARLGGRLAVASTWCWGRRELVLWISIASMGAALLLR